MKNNYKQIMLILVSILIVVGLFIIFEIKHQAKQKEIKLITLKDQFETCKKNVLFEYWADWEQECKSRNLKENCMLPIINAEQLGDRLKDKEKDCFETYKLEVNLIK